MEGSKPAKQRQTENKIAKIKKYCKLTTEFEAKGRKTKWPKTRRYCTLCTGLQFTHIGLSCSSSGTLQIASKQKSEDLLDGNQGRASWLSPQGNTQNMNSTTFETLVL